MPNALHTSKNGFVVGNFLIPMGMSVKEVVHDGDTVAISPNSYLSTRLLGIDAPEVSFTLPGTKQFLPINNQKWQDFLADPFTGQPPFQPALSPALKAHLVAATGAGCAANHHQHAKAAEATLTNRIDADLKATPQDKTFGFFLAFGNDVLDRYGRLLCYLHHDDKQNAPRPYNEQMLAAGMASPYFIWPNIKPFLKDKTVPTPNQLIANASLDAARQAVGNARATGTGIFAAGNSLRLQSHELRFLARTDDAGNRPGPDRWVIDLSQATDQLLAPQRYIEIPNIEDRLYVNEEHVPLFESRGWVKAP